MKRFLKRLVPLFDVLLLPAMLLAIAVMRVYRRLPLRGMRLNRRLLEWGSVFPILGNYREPSFKRSDLRLDPAADRNLPGMDLNLDEQLRVLERFSFQEELRALPRERPAGGGAPAFYYHNASFESGDAEYLYSFIRAYKPARIIEVGSGSSTLIALEAIRRNRQDDPDHACQVTCIEPYVNYWNAWLDQLPVEIVRKPVETVPLDVFRSLRAGDLLFLDSSHVIRAQGDVLYECLEVLPSLAPGVFVHVHDIFTPRDHQALWHRDVNFSNEQYLLEALLTQNPRLKVIGALNYLAHHQAAALAARFPVYAEEQAFREPGSFWLRTVR
jgi:hypothetical protein